MTDVFIANQAERVAKDVKVEEYAMIKPWAFEFNTILGRDIPDFHDRARVQEAFDTTLDHSVRLEELGFEGLFFSEHHFMDSLSPSPHLLLAASAARTKTLKLGVMGSVLAFHQPWRMAEELGMLDYITNGRLEIGVASGVPPEFTFVNIPQDDVRSMYWESLEYLEKAFQSEVVTHKGTYWNFEEVPVLPLLKHVERRRKWMTVYSEATCRRAARLGYHICGGAQDVEDICKVYDAYRDEASNIGYDVTPDDIGIRRHVLIGETDEAANELFQILLPAAKARALSSVAPMMKKMEKLLGHDAMAGVVESGVKDAAFPKREGTELAPGEPDRRGSSLKPGGDFFAFKDEYIVGSPTTVADKIIDQCQRLGAGHFLGVHFMPLTKDEFDQHYGRWAEVIPILRKAEI